MVVARYDRRRRLLTTTRPSPSILPKPHPASLHPRCSTSKLTLTRPNHSTRFLNRHKEAQKLAVGFDTFCVHNNSKTDQDLTFSTQALVALEARLEPAERHDYLLVWRPMPVASAGDGFDGDSVPSGALAGVGGDMCWRRYCHTQMAGIYRMLFRAAVPPLGVMRHTVGGSALAADVAGAAREAAEAAAAEAGKKRRIPKRLVDHIIAHDFKGVR